MLIMFPTFLLVVKYYTQIHLSPDGCFCVWILVETKKGNRVAIMVPVKHRNRPVRGVF